MPQKELHKQDIEFVQKNNIFYEIDSDGKVKTYKSWLGNSFAFMYDPLMEKSIFPKKLASDFAVHNQILTREISPLRHKNVLELGAGTGEAARYLHESNTYAGIDISPGLLRKAITKFDRAGFKNSRFYVLDVEELPFSPATFDVCLCILTLNFFDNLDKVIKQVHTVLKTGGCFYGAVPVPERNVRNSKIQGTLRTVDELEECFRQNGFRFVALPDQNGAVFYFTATKIKD
jgi:SAM-dependent methyltransferase